MSRLNKTARDVAHAIETYQFHEAVYSLYHFFWDDFCDWYIELSKPDIQSWATSEQVYKKPLPAAIDARSRILTVLEQALRLLHPFMPFITEELWQRLPGIGADSLHPAYGGAEPTIMLTEYPRADEKLINEQVEREMQTVIELTSRVRNIRNELGIKPSEQIEIIIRTADEKLLETLRQASNQVMRLTGAGKGVKRPAIPGVVLDVPRASARAALAGGAELAVPLEGLIDFAQERARLGKEGEKLAKELERLEAQLGNPQFVERAPAEKVEELRQRSEDIRQRNVALEQMLEALKG
jgi:valyl-tRNA synthetase